jgi:hypothetical protein
MNPKYHLTLLNHLSPHFLQNLKYRLSHWPLMFLNFLMYLRSLNFHLMPMFLKNLRYRLFRLSL